MINSRARRVDLLILYRGKWLVTPVAERVRAGRDIGGSQLEQISF
jgi:hypothetical protein